MFIFSATQKVKAQKIKIKENAKNLTQFNLLYHFKLPQGEE